MADLTPTTFAQQVLAGLGIAQTQGGVEALVGWENAEGGHWNNTARFNPLNTTKVPSSGAYSNTGTQGNIKAYSSWGQGVNATVATLQLPAYAGIRAALAKGDPSAVASAIGSSPWGTSGALVSKTIAAATGTIAKLPALASLPKGSPAGSTTKPSSSTAGDTSGLLTDAHKSGALKALVTVGIVGLGAALVHAGINTLTGGASHHVLKTAAKGVATGVAVA